MNFRLITKTRRIARRLKEQSGVSMLPAMTAVFVGSLISMGAWTAAHGDIKLQQNDRFAKRAFTATQTGLADFVQHLAVDSSYWSYCDDPPSGNPGAVNDTDIGVSAHPDRRWMPASVDETIDYQYTIDLIPTNGFGTCKERSNRAETMIQQSTGTFRVRVTGRAGPPVPSTATIAPDPRQPGTFVAKGVASIEQWRQLRWKKRSIVIDFRRRGFLDFAYFTDIEGQDPPVQPNPTYAEANCRDYYRDGRSSKMACQEIQFTGSDEIKGPFHTNDSIFARDGATFGNVGKNDRIEISADTCEIRGATHSGCGTSTPVINGTLVTGANAPVLQLPDVNEDLAEYGKSANGGITYSGATSIVLRSDGKMNVTNNGVTTNGVNYPTNGVIFVSNKVGCTDYNINQSYWFPPACGSVEVEGTYNVGLTIAAEADIIITEDLDALDSEPNAVLGLIANKYVRVRHYSTGGQASDTCNNMGTTRRVNRIEAAVLALQHSFMVDQWACGGGLGDLTIVGALTQKFRGVVGRGSSGYTKDYNYDYRLRYLTPPYFLTPSLSGWRLSRYREQVPACACNEN